MDSVCLEILKRFSEGEAFWANKVARTLAIGESTAFRHLRHLTDVGVLNSDGPNRYSIRSNGNPDHSIFIQLLSELAAVDKEIQRLEENRKGLIRAIGKAIQFCVEEEHDERS